MLPFHLDLTMLAAIWMASAVVMVPLLGLTIRFAIVPLLEAITRARQVELEMRLEEAARRRA
jgi:hypothetical protein